MSIDKALLNIMEGNLDEMRQNFSSVLTQKAAQKLEERKIEIAKNYFGQMTEEEQLDELSRKTLNSYVKKSSASEKEIDDQIWDKSTGNKKAEKLSKKANNRSIGRSKARMRLKGKYEPVSMKYSAKE